MDFLQYLKSQKKLREDESEQNNKSGGDSSQNNSSQQNATQGDNTQSQQQSGDNKTDNSNPNEKPGDEQKPQEDKQEDKKEETKQQEPVVVAETSINDIIVKLHEQALEKSNTKDIIQNTAIKGGKLSAAGEHLLVAKQEGLEKTKAYDLIKTYVQWFLGPDVADSLKEEDVVDMNGGEDSYSNADKKEEKEKQEQENKEEGETSENKEGEEKKSEDTKEKTNESVKHLTFSEFLLLEDDNQSSNTNDEDKPIENMAEEKDDDGDEEMSEEKDENKENGYCTVYKLLIPGVNEKDLDGNIKNLGGDTLSFTLRTFSLWGGESKSHKIVLKDTITPDDYQTTAKKIIEKQFKGAANIDTVAIKKNNIVLNQYKDKLSNKDISKIKGKDNTYSLFITVNEKNKNKNLINTKSLSKICNYTWKVIMKNKKIKKLPFTGKDIKPEDIVILYNFDDSEEIKNQKEAEERNLIKQHGFRVDKTDKTEKEEKKKTEEKKNVDNNKSNNGDSKQKDVKQKNKGKI